MATNAPAMAGSEDELLMRRLRARNPDFALLFDDYHAALNAARHWLDQSATARQRVAQYARLAGELHCEMQSWVDAERDLLDQRFMALSRPGASRSPSKER